MLEARHIPDSVHVMSFVFVFCFPLPPQVSIEDMEKEKLTLQSDAERYSDQVADLTCV